MQRRRLLVLLAACSLPAGRPAFAAQFVDSALLQRLRGGGHILLIRHAATTPGIGDPEGFELAQCRTQRNLSAGGRRDAQALGAAIRAHGIPAARVWSSRWCRCLDTARLAFGQAEPAPLLDSLFGQDASQVRTATSALRTRLAALDHAGNTVLVTHDINIRALAGQSAAPGGVLAARTTGGGLEVLGRVWRPD
jgi:broad specificity phosphatase PhoE